MLGRDFGGGLMGWNIIYKEKISQIEIYFENASTGEACNLR